MGTANGESRCSPMKVPVAVSEVSSRFQFMRMHLYGSRRPVVQAIAWVLRLVLLLGMLTPSVSLASDGEIVSVRHAMLPGGRLQLDIGLAAKLGYQGFSGLTSPTGLSWIFLMSPARLSLVYTRLTAGQATVSS